MSADQFFWVRRVAELGAATPPDPPRAAHHVQQAAALRSSPTTALPPVDCGRAAPRGGVDSAVDLLQR
ncbi:MAG: hypothetical protein JOY78_02625 [Pseudonocardia sp.]|nr:hypothetical protein [Pseudonocardia sp.]